MLRSADTIDSNVQVVQLKLDANDATVTTIQTTLSAIQASIRQLTTSVNGIKESIAQRQPAGHDDDGSVQGDNADLRAHNGRGSGLRGLGHQPQLCLGAQCVPVQDEDGLGKPKFSIPRFEGSTDVEEYVTWELKMEKLWSLHDYTEHRKVKLDSSEFDGYTLRWWDGIMT